MDARKHGQADFRNGKTLAHNPYRSIKQGKRAWIKGWHEGREAFDRAHAETAKPPSA